MPSKGPLADAQQGDWIVIHGRGVGKPGQRGLILEVLGGPGHEHYRVRWDEEHESIYFPGSDATIERSANREAAHPGS
jgi:hypothetical protein